ncbi:MAG: D-Ala-D-Ala carboxypeptidase family metallohydrolase [Eubacteriaceae bacterium]
MTFSAAAIKSVQLKLNKLGYNLQVDGILGSKTKQAVKTFQKKYKLIVDGIPGPITQGQLNKLLAQITPSKTVKDWSIYPHFKREEFRCKCGKYCNGYPAEPETKLLIALEKIRSKYNKPVIITYKGGLRCSKFNSLVKGSSPTSRHITGGAADIYIKGVNKYELLDYCKKIKAQGYIKYCYTNNTNMGSAVHINV